MATPDTSQNNVLPAQDQDVSNQKEPLDIWQKLIIVSVVFVFIALAVAVAAFFFPLASTVNTTPSSGSSSTIYQNEMDVPCVLSGAITGTLTLNVKRIGNQVFVSWPFISGIVATPAQLTVQSQTGTNPLPTWAYPADPGTTDQNQVYFGTVIEANTTPNPFYGPSYVAFSAVSSGSIIFTGVGSNGGGSPFPVGGMAVYPGSAMFSATS